jgi:hypothetical protein
MRLKTLTCLITLFHVFVCTGLYAQETGSQDLWNTGTAAQIIPMNELPVTPQEISLSREIVWIDLFPGFAVVKSVFTFSNQTDQPLSIKIGYPVRGQFPTAIPALAHFDDARGLKISVNGQTLATRLEEGRSNGNDPSPFTFRVWDQTFPPDSLTTIIVESILPTHFSRLVAGERFSTGNAFGISLTGAEAWDGPIGQLQVLIRLNGGLMLADIRGLIPDGSFIGNLGHLQFDKTNLEPDSSQNLVIWYNGAPADYPFEKKVTPLEDALRSSMDTFPVTAFNDPAFQPLRRYDFDVSAGGITLASVLYFIMFFTPWVILIGFVVFILRGKRKRKAARRTNDQEIK